MRRPWTWLISLATACATPERPPPQPPIAGRPPATVTVDSPEPEPASEADEADAELVGRLRAGAVHHGAFATKTFYSWTKPDQIEGLRKHRWLLTRTRSPHRGGSLFDKRLKRSADPIAALMRSDRLKYRRFAWSSPWPTFMGWLQPSYGDHLIRITLKDEAILAHFDSRLPERWRFVDITGKEVPPSEARADPSRIGAVYHVWHGDEEPDAGAFPAGELAFREYVICNESMVARWTIGPDLQPILDAASRTLLELAAHFRSEGRQPPASLLGWNHHVDNEIWPQPPATDPLSLYEANLALPSEPYQPSAEHIDSLVAGLEAAEQIGPALTHQPTARFDQPPPPAALPKPPPPPPCVPDPTFMVPCK